MRFDGVEIKVGKRQAHNLLKIQRSYGLYDGCEKTLIGAYRTIILQVSNVWPLSVTVIR